jgi:hypothetical protein
MNDTEYKRAQTLTSGIEALTPCVYILNQNGFTDEDISLFYNVDINVVLKARGILQEPVIPWISKDEADEIIARFASKS